MIPPEQVVVISARAASFTAVCELCREIDVAEGYSSSTFAGRLDLDIGHGTFLCRRGHSVRVQRAEPPARFDVASQSASSSAA